MEEVPAGHSVNEYLLRQSTEKLETMLCYCLNRGNAEHYEDMAPKIYNVLIRREERYEYKVPTFLQEEWKRYCDSKEA